LYFGERLHTAIICSLFAFQFRPSRKRPRLTHLTPPIDSQRIAYAKAQSNVVARLEAKGAGAGKKKRGREQLEAQAPASEAGPKAKEARIVNSVPNKILFAQNLPAEVTHAMLNAVFATAPGFVGT
jgi:hypothetical protein